MLASEASPRGLARLNAAVATTTHPIERARCLAERAAWLARLGRLDEAAQDRRAARDEQGPAADPAVAVALAFAEAMAEFHRDFNLAARDRLRRAHALAGAARLRPQRALAAAWLAHLDYLQHDLPSLARHLDEALGLAEPDAHDARARACLVAAQAIHWAGDAQAATVWYARARNHAQAAGDDATRSALMHNQAWLRGVQARQVRLGWGGAGPAAPLEPADPADSAIDGPQASPAALHAQAARSLDQWIGSQSLGASLRLLQALLAADAGDDAAAAVAWDGLEPALQDQGLGHLLAWVAADRAWRAAAGSAPDAAAARRHAEAALAALALQTDAEDRGLTHARLAAVFGRLGAADAAAHHATCAQADAVTHRERQQAMRAALEPVLARHPEA